MADFKREQFRFHNLGMKTNAPADALPDGKHVFLQNVRSYQDQTIGSRPPLKQSIAAPAGGSSVLALEPTIGVYKIGGKLYVNGTQIDNGYFAGAGASLVPFRPNASPNAWEYVFDASKSTKVYVPSSGSPVVKNTGIIEPQAPCDAAVNNQFDSFINLGAVWTPGGVAGNVGNSNRVVDSVGVVFVDPASAGNRCSFTVSPSQSYSRGMVLSIAGALNMVDDVFPNLATPLGIANIYYYSGSTGRCVVVPVNMGTEDATLYDQLLLAVIRRGAIVNIGGENCYVLNSSVGPNGTICFETTTVHTHTPGDLLTVVAAVSVIGSGITSGMAVASQQLQFNNTGAGIGTVQSTLSVNPFIDGVSSFQPDDYIHISILHGTNSVVNEIKILFDVSDGTFTKDFYYYTIRPSDLRDAILNNSTQLAAAQIASQRELIDAEQIIFARHQGRTASSAQIGSGQSEWAEIWFPIRSLTRVGETESRTLQNVNAVQILFNTTGSTNPLTTAINSFSVIGGFQPDVGPGGTPYQYWLVPRDSTTGVQGNPSPAMRYGVSPRRQQVRVPLPLSYVDPQMDTWDVYRMGGSITQERYIGSVSIGTAQFNDNYSDATAEGGRALARDNYQPFPSIGPPIKTLATKAQTIVGTVAVLLFDLAANNPAAAATLNQIGNLLPGNECNVGQQVFTLWCRPILIGTFSDSQAWLFQFVENAGTLTNPVVQINEPTLAAQNLKCVWGPDSNGVFFAVQDPLRPGVISHTNPNNPDGASDAFNDDICPPTEPLQNGALLNQTSIVFSTKRAWAGYPKQGGSGYRWVEIPVGDGLAAEFGICTDGKRVYYVGHHGIMATSGGPAESLTDADLYNLFPHEGVLPATNISTPGGLIPAPDYNYKSQFRLSVVNGYLYFDYIATILRFGVNVQVPETLVCDLVNRAWSLDQSGFNPITIHAGTTNTGDKQQLFIGDSTGAIFVEDSSPTPNTGENVGVTVCTREIMPDLRAESMFGDASLDCAPLSALIVNPVILGNVLGTTTNVPASGFRVNEVIDLQGQQIVRSLGLLINWVDTGVTTLLYGWGPSIVPQPEDTQNRFGDWDDCGMAGAKFIQGFILECDTFGATKQLSIRSADDLTVKQVFQIQHIGQSEKAYTFTAPFIAHLVRDEPDAIPWRKFGFKWVFERTPEFVLNWIAQPTSHGLPGYQHVKEMLFAYNATAPVDFTVTIDGTPFTYQLPATNGYQKVLIPFQAAKGLVFQYGATSTQPFQVWVNDIEVKVKPWGDPGAYTNWQKMGAAMGAGATI